MAAGDTGGVIGVLTPFVRLEEPVGRWGWLAGSGRDCGNGAVRLAFRRRSRRIMVMPGVEDRHFPGQKVTGALDVQHGNGAGTPFRCS